MTCNYSLKRYHALFVCLFERLMKRFWEFFFLILGFFYSILPLAKEVSEIEVGGLLYHFRELYEGRRDHYGVRNYLKPVFLVNYQGWLAGYFKNSHQKNSFVVGVRRHLKAKPLGEYKLVPGYAAGMVTGYCKGKGADIYDDCSGGRKWRPVPYGQVFIKLKKDNLSVNLGYSFVLSYLTVSYFF